MQYQQATWTSPDVFRFMEIATAIGELTTDPQLLSQIPDLLTDTLDLAQVVIGIVQQTGELEATISFMAASSRHAAGANLARLRDSVLMVHSHAREIQVGHAVNTGISTGVAFAQAVAPGRDEMSLVEGTRIEPGPANPAIVSRVVDETHRLVMIAEYGSLDAAQRHAALQDLQMIADHMARVVHLMLEWRSKPTDLGLPFENLTDREWMVLWALYSDDGEKQMAERLKLSPHTLHSHVKNIYRKTNVQGRLQLIHRLRKALHARRMRLLVASSKHSLRLFERAAG